jgi:hypothetical protein
VHRSIELEATAVARGHAREPAALGLERRRLIGAEVHADVHLVAGAADGHLRRAARVGGIGALPDEHEQHPPELGLVAEDRRALAHLDLHAGLGRDLPEQRGHVDLAASPARHRVAVQRGQHAHGLVEAVERPLDPARGLVGRRRDVRDGAGDALAELLCSAARFLGEEPGELGSGESVGHGGLDRAAGAIAHDDARPPHALPALLRPQTPRSPRMRGAPTNAIAACATSRC